MDVIHISAKRLEASDTEKAFVPALFVKNKTFEVETFCHATGVDAISHLDFLSMFPHMPHVVSHAFIVATAPLDRTSQTSIRTFWTFLPTVSLCGFSCPFVSIWVSI